MSNVPSPSPQIHPSGLPRSSPTFHFLAGLSTGVFSAALLQPVDLLKTRVQQSRSISLTSTLSSITSGPRALRNLWRGTIPSIIRTGFGSALYFTTLNALRQRIARSSAFLPGFVATSTGSSSSSLPRLSNLANLTTGGVARASAGFVLMPLTVIKVRYESNLYSYRSLWEAISGIVKTEGIRGFFSGFGATAVRDAPYAGVYVLFYEQMKPMLGSLVSGNTEKSTNLGLVSAQSMSTSQSAVTNFASGVFAAGAATALTNPFDAVKTRLQLMPRKYVNMAQAARIILKEEGTRSLFDGLALRMGRKALSSALVWTLYEEMVRKAERRWVGSYAIDKMNGTN